MNESMQLKNIRWHMIHIRSSCLHINYTNNIRMILQMYDISRILKSSLERNPYFNITAGMCFSKIFSFTKTGSLQEVQILLFISHTTTTYLFKVYSRSFRELWCHGYFYLIQLFSVSSHRIDSSEKHITCHNDSYFFVDFKKFLQYCLFWIWFLVLFQILSRFADEQFC